MLLIQRSGPSPTDPIWRRHFTLILTNRRKSIWKTTSLAGTVFPMTYTVLEWETIQAPGPDRIIELWYSLHLTPGLAESVLRCGLGLLSGCGLPSAPLPRDSALEASRRASATVGNCRRASSSHSSVVGKLSYIALSCASPTAPIYRLHDARLPAPLAEPQRRVLRALVAVMDHRSLRLAPSDRHRQPVAHQLGRHARRHRPANDPPAPPVEAQRRGAATPPRWAPA